MRVDAHQHFWKFNQVRDTWIDNNMEKLKQDFLPQNSLNILKKNNIQACISIQADQSEEETLYLIELAEQYNFIRGVVGWIDLKAENVIDRLDFFSQFKQIKGFRHVVQSEPDGFMLNKNFLKSISNLEKYNFTYDILIYSKQLKEASDLVKKFPYQKFILDHLGKPLIAQQIIEPWKSDIARLAEAENVCCKISGMLTESNWQKWKEVDFLPYMDTIFDCFGVERIIYGSDYPVSLLAGTYEEQLNIIENYLSCFSSTEKEKIFSKNAIRFYNCEI